MFRSIRRHVSMLACALRYEYKVYHSKAGGESHHDYQQEKFKKLKCTDALSLVSTVAGTDQAAVQPDASRRKSLLVRARRWSQTTCKPEERRGKARSAWLKPGSHEPSSSVQPASAHPGMCSRRQCTARNTEPGTRIVKLMPCAPPCRAEEEKKKETTKQKKTGDITAWAGSAPAALIQNPFALLCPAGTVLFDIRKYFHNAVRLSGHRHGSGWSGCSDLSGGSGVCSR